jgi:hypothetical protein
MKPFLTALAILVSPLVYADDSKVEVANMPIYCVTDKKLYDTVMEFKEIPVAEGISLRKIDGKEYKSPLVILINKDNSSYTIAEKVSETHFCIIAVGENFRPVAK